MEPQYCVWTQHGEIRDDENRCIIPLWVHKGMKLEGFDRLVEHFKGKRITKAKLEKCLLRTATLAGVPPQRVIDIFTEVWDAEVHDPTYFVLPPLYTTAKTGKERVWKVWVIGNFVYKTYGDVGGKMVELPPREAVGMNIGKVNETTPEEQARLEAEREWIKQLDKNYHPEDGDEEGQAMFHRAMTQKGAAGGHGRGVRILKDADDDELENDDAPVKRGETQHKLDLLPMHAEKFEPNDMKKMAKYFNFKAGVYVQPKFDGWRGVARLEGEKVLITTRNGKQYPWYTKIKQDLKRLFLAYAESYPEAPQLILDGEMYAHRLYDPKGKEYPMDERFQLLSGAGSVSRSKPSPIDDQVQYHVFDVVDLKLDQDKRFAIRDNVKALVDELGLTHIKFASTKLVHSFDEAMELHAEYAADLGTEDDAGGYEGIVLRDRSLMYILKNRSGKMRKYKEFEDMECPIVDAKEGVGKEKGKVVWICECNGERVDVRSRGTYEEREKMYKNRYKYIGKPLTIRYQGLSDKGVPRFPVGIAIRDEFVE